MTNPLDETTAEPTIDQLFARKKNDLTPADFRRIIAHHRDERATWLDKQDAKGKDE